MASSFPAPSQSHVAQKFLPDFLKAEEFANRKEFGKAVALYRKILRALPRNLVAGLNLGSALLEMNQSDQALAALRQALKHHPNDPELHYNIGVVLQREHQTFEAKEHYETTLRFKPHHLQALENLASLEMNLGHFEIAKGYLDRVLEREPTRAGTLFTMALLMLLEGEWHDGWHLYEYRWETPDFQTDNLDTVSRRWQSLEELKDRSVLLVREQGLGDTIQFCRYAFLLAHHGAKVSLLVPDSLQPLMKNLSLLALPQPITVLTEAEFSERQHYDYWLPMLSAPLALMKNYTQIPSIKKYLFVADEDITHAQARLPANGRRNVGLVWSGNRSHKNDQHRSAPFAEFARLLDLGLDVNFHILQTEIRPGDEAAVQQYIDAGKLIDQRDDLTDFKRTAGLLECMDLLIAVDTSVVHLAGALGRPTWIALAYTPDFRWLLQREDSPWYPSVRLLRQTSYDDWHGLITRIAQELQVWLTQAEQAATPAELTTPA